RERGWTLRFHERFALGGVTGVTSAFRSGDYLFRDAVASFLNAVSHAKCALPHITKRGNSWGMRSGLENASSRNWGHFRLLCRKRFISFALTWKEMGHGSTAGRTTASSAEAATTVT